MPPANPEERVEPPSELYVLIDRFGLIVRAERDRANANRLVVGPYANMDAKIVVYARSTASVEAVEAAAERAYRDGFRDALRRPRKTTSEDMHWNDYKARHFGAIEGD